MKKFTVANIEFKVSKCNHYYVRGRRVRKAKFTRRYEIAKSIEEVKYKPYVTVTHKETGRKFQLNQNYLLLSNVVKVSGNIQDWDGWNVTRNSQKPDWSHGLPDSEFYAVWHYRK